MLQELIFVVGGFLVSVTSAQLCSVCGDGYQVGNLSAIGSFPGLPDTLVTCDDIELAGRQGLIPVDQCLALPLLIFETCDCQVNTTDNTRERANAFYGAGYSSLRRAQSSAIPVAAPSFPGSAAPTHIDHSNVQVVESPPGYQFGVDPAPSPVPNGYSDSNEDQDTTVPLLGCFIPFVLFCACTCRRNCQDSASREIMVTPRTYVMVGQRVVEQHPIPSTPIEVEIELTDKTFEHPIKC
jgi:hypothetical protein